MSEPFNHADHVHNYIVQDIHDSNLESSPSWVLLVFAGRLRPTIKPPPFGLNYLLGVIVSLETKSSTVSINVYVCDFLGINHIDQKLRRRSNSNQARHHRWR